VLEKFFETLYNKVFVNILLEGARTVVYIELCSTNLEMIDNAQSTFQTQSLNSKMLDFISSYTKESPYFYISVLDTSNGQGAIPTCDKNRQAYFQDLSACEYKCVDKKWIYFTLKTDLYAIEKRYQKCGVDFIFSPFTLLTHFFKDKIDSDLAMYAIVQTDGISVVVFDKEELLFGKYLDMHHIFEEESLSSGDIEDEDIDLNESIDLESIDVDAQEMDLIDDFGDIEDLDSIEEIDEFSEHRDLEEELLEAAEEPSESSSSDNMEFNEDYQRFNLLKSAIANYYEDKKYESAFIENIYIADGVGVTPELKRYLEEEMFLNVYTRQIDTTMEMCELGKMEFKV